MARAIRVVAPSRLHFGLVDLGGVTGRSFGGSGAMLNWPRTVVRVEPSGCVKFSSLATSNADLESVTAAIGRMLDEYPEATGGISIEEMPPPHCGLGSKTTLVLSCLCGLASANGLTLSSGELFRFSGRGGASGVGLHGFILGGLIADAGHPGRRIGPWLPSGVSTPPSLPLLISRIAAPSDWNVHLVNPGGEGLSGKDEVEFFEASTPLPCAEVLSALAETWHGIVPSFASADLGLLKISLSNLSGIGFKRLEIKSRPESAQAIQVISSVTGCPVGMSSMGPLVFAISKKECAGDVAAIIYGICQNEGWEWLGTTSFSNGGVNIEYED